MNAQLTTFTSLEHYEAELAGSITPMIAEKFEALDDNSADLLQVSDAVVTTPSQSSAPNPSIFVFSTCMNV